MPDAAPPSPCIGICALDRLLGLCVGCWRSRAEVAAWRDMNEPARAAVVAQLHLRRVKHTRLNISALSPTTG